MEVLNGASESSFDAQMDALRDELDSILSNWKGQQPNPGSTVLSWPRVEALIDLATDIAQISPDVGSELKQALKVADPRLRATAAALQSPTERLAELAGSICKQAFANGIWSAVVERAQRAASIAEATNRVDIHADALTMLAKARRALHDLNRAAAVYEELIQICESADLSGRLCAVYDNYANILIDLERYDDAADAFQKGRDYARTTEDQNHLTLNEASLYRRLGEYDRAHKCYRDLISTVQGVSGAELFMGIALDNEAMLYMHENEPDRAIPLARHAKNLLIQKERADRIVNELTLAGAFLAAGDRKSAGAEFTKAHALAVEEAEQTIDEEHYRSGLSDARSHELQPTHPAWGHFLLGLKALHDHDLLAARMSLENAATAANEAGDAAMTLRVRANLAEVLRRLGDITAAARLADQNPPGSGRRGTCIA